jgi:hypothetical protein
MWTKEKILQYISDGIEENLHLDYKGAGSIDKKGEKKKEISKDVSAFANSDGGTIIYGVREFDDKEKNHLPEKIDPINGVEYTKEWLEQIINSTISPRIPLIKITPIQTDKHKNNRVIYVVGIPKSYTAHQAQDKKYYRRYNFESIAMDDWEIKDIINRQNKTDIQIKFVPRTSREIIDRFLKNNSNFDLELDIWAENKGNKVAQYVDCFLSGGPEAAKYIIEPFVNRNDFEHHVSNEKERKITINDDEFIIGLDRIPILPKTSRVIGFIKIKADFIGNECKLRLQVATEDGSKSKLIIGREIIEK